MADDQNPELPLTPPPGGGDGTGIPGALNIQPVNIEEEMKKSYLDYSMSVIIGRALPDVRARSRKRQRHRRTDAAAAARNQGYLSLQSLHRVDPADPDYPTVAASR